jgi:hypothetical protein
MLVFMARTANQTIEKAITISIHATSQPGQGGAILAQTFKTSGIVATANTAIAMFSNQDG